MLLYFHDRFEKNQSKVNFRKCHKYSDASHQLKKQKILGKHDLKLEIFMFSIVNSTAFVFQQLSFTSNHLRLFHRI